MQACMYAGNVFCLVTNEQRKILFYIVSIY